jgi:predicted dehydrogenase
MTANGGRIGVLIAGCGAAAAMHARTLRRFAQVELYFASRDARRAEKFRQKFGGRGAFGSYEAGIADPRVNVVLVTTPPASHVDVALAALAAGKHVIVEKPAFMSVDEAHRVRDAAGAAQVFVAENYAYKPVARLLKQLISNGDLGDVRFVSINATKSQSASAWRGDPAVSGGGAMFESGVHWLSFAAHIGLDVCGVDAVRVAGTAGNDRSSLVVLRYANGGVATIAHSWELPAPFGGLRLSKVQGTRGSVTFESNGLLVVVSGRRRMIRVPVFSDPRGYRAMFADFLGAIETGRAPEFTFDMATQDLELLEEAERSMNSHHHAALTSRVPAFC